MYYLLCFFFVNSELNLNFAYLFKAACLGLCLTTLNAPSKNLDKFCIDINVYNQS